jgi:CRISPR-associated protein Cmx8
MPKTPAKATTKAESVTIKYDLFDLPTAQHKAGLAGLILQARSLRERFRDAPVPEMQVEPTSATVRFTAAAVQRLFDDLYDASWEEVRVRSKWPGAELKREEEVEEVDPETQKVKKVRYFVYETVQPCGHFLRQHLPEMDRSKDWLKLWRDMLWAIPRNKPKSRIPFEQRADGKSSKEGWDAWASLLAVDKARRKNGFYTAEVAGSLWLGAQAANAEDVPFRGRAEQNLLLHFWPLTSLIFVPQRIDNDGEGEFVGYTLAIPEVAHLEYFCDDYPQMLHDLGREVRGFRPGAAVIDLPAQAALKFLEHLARLAQGLTARKQISDSISSIEYMHLVKIGNNVKSMAAGRVAPRPGIVERYQAIVGSRERPAPYRNPLFRSALLRALLEERDWYECMAPLFAERPWPFFVRGENTPRGLPWFAADAAAKFQAESETFEKERKAMTDTQNPTTNAPAPSIPLPLLIHRLIRNYVLRKTEKKSGLKWDEIKERKGDDGKVLIPAEFRKAREEVASDAFLSMRSRREQDFVDYFTSSICSVGQFLREDEFHIVARALLTCPEDVKTLSLLALSASS